MSACMASQRGSPLLCGSREPAKNPPTVPTAAPIAISLSETGVVDEPRILDTRPVESKSAGRRLRCIRIPRGRTSVSLGRDPASVPASRACCVDPGLARLVGRRSEVTSAPDAAPAGTPYQSAHINAGKTSNGARSWPSLATARTLTAKPTMGPATAPTSNALTETGVVAERRSHCIRGASVLGRRERCAAGPVVVRCSLGSYIAMGLLAGAV